MKRILLCLEDYNELIFLQTSLKKLGFDIEGIQNPIKVNELLMTFNPRLIFMTRNGKKVNGKLMAEKINKRMGLPRIVLINAPHQDDWDESVEDINVDDVIESPINIRTVLKLTALHTDTSEESLLSKYEKIFVKDRGNRDIEEKDGGSTDSESVTVSGNLKPEKESQWVKGARPSAESAEARSRRFAQVLEGLSEDEKVVKTLDKKSVVAYTKKLREAQSSEPTEIDLAKRDFVKALFASEKPSSEGES